MKSSGSRLFEEEYTAEEQPSEKRTIIDFCLRFKTLTQQ